jgi:DNA modification methylase
MLWERLLLLKDLLAERGSIFIHVGIPVSHLVRAMAEEIFGEGGFQNEVAWQRHDPHNDAVSRFGVIHDNIMWFSKGSPLYNYEDVRDDLSAAAEREFSLLELPTGQILDYKGNEHRQGRRLKLDDATWKGTSPAKRFVWRGATPSDKREWMYDKEGMEAALARGELYLRDPDKGAARCRKRYLDANKGILLQDIWTNAGRMKGGSSYPTQKPEPLLSRIIKACSNEGDLVLDCFGGSGTTAVVAETLQRRWIACDLSRFAIHLTRKRLLDLPDVRSFVVQNLGKYERQVWQAAEFGEQAEAKQAAYRKLILDLYHATPVNGYAWLHGVKGGRMVHVGAVDSPVSVGDVTAMAGEFRRAVGTGEGSPTTNGVDVLGWDFAFEMNEVAKQKAAEAGISMRFLKIPHDVMDKRARDQGDIRFFELAALSVDSAVKGKYLTLTLTDFVIPPDEVPEDVQRAITKWEQWIDYWAVDWDNKGDTFHNQWQDYRTRKKRELQKSVSHEYEKAGEYVVVVKVIDILGNDTTKTLTVKVG